MESSFFGSDVNAIRFRDRSEAGRRLAEALDRYRGQEMVVYALPRGGVVLGVEIARAFQAPLDLSIPRKVAPPLNPEYGICAVTESGARVCTPDEVARVDQDWLECEIAKEREEAKRRRLVYLSDREPPDVRGKIAILCDDGIATGLTMRAAIQEVKYRQPEHVVVAIPVVPRETAPKLKQEINALVALDIPEFYLGAVGAYYDFFPQLTDEEVIELMNSLTAPGTE
jgi:predicted phosphoribosyltransferase